jgi:hypothetical protein
LTSAGARRTIRLVYGSERNGTFPPFLGLDGEAYWNDLAGNHRAHVRQAVTLTIAIAVLVVLSALVHPALLGCAAVLAFFLAVTLVMVARSRPTGSIPEAPRSAAFDVELDE